MKRDDSASMRTLSDTEYVRPNQDWICGKSNEGCSCPLGPSSTGECRATFECEPAKQLESWVCTRSNSMGGECVGGPLPDGSCCRPIARCVPHRSLKSRRFQISIGVFALAVGVASILLAFPSGSAMVSPGPLTRQHTTTANSCADCHSVDNHGMVTWLSNAMHRTESVSQSQKCLVCHQEFGSTALNPHSLPDHQLLGLTNHAKASPSSSGNWVVTAAQTAFGSPHEHGNLQCSTCHKEHQGSNHDLKHLGNQQCQVCHVNSFHSFADGHAEFDSYPAKRRTRIYFDHESHYAMHFVDESSDGDVVKSVSCTQCHAIDSSGSVMELRGYEQTCAKCHDEQIRDDLIPGFVVAAIPGLDLDTLTDTGHDPGLWPDVVRLHAGAQDEIPVLMKLLLSSDRRYRDIRLRMDRLNLADLRNCSDDDLSTVHQFSWLLKEKLQNWGNGGLKNGDTPFAGSSSLAALIPTSRFIEIQQKWFPDLQIELEARNKYEGFELSETMESIDLAQVASEQNRYSRSIRNGWYLQDSDLTLRYRPTGHADPFFAKIMDLIVELENNKLTVKDDPSNSIDQTLLDELFESVSSPYLPGRCTKCHTIDRSLTGSAVNWRGKRSDSQISSFTRFKHSPHLASMSNAECATCHAMSESKKELAGVFRPEFIRTEGQLSFAADSFRCDFSNISKQNCSSCHSQQAAGNSCLNCHNYHVR